MPVKVVTAAFGVRVKTVYKWVERFEAQGPKGLEQAAPVVRYEREAAGDLIHIDIEKLGRLGLDRDNLSRLHS
ncbi:helix-turn-helix domain-containing protein [Phenylobacterium sp.]|uniref:helix-turn-helix domain-containing protein n=1 Tax=Phenylobacterium sp. TaxID=1871053 RepID=UPI00391ABDF6